MDCRSSGVISRAFISSSDRDLKYLSDAVWHFSISLSERAMFLSAASKVRALISARRDSAMDDSLSVTEMPLTVCVMISSPYTRPYPFSRFEM